MTSFTGRGNGNCWWLYAWPSCQRLNSCDLVSLRQWQGELWISPPTCRNTVWAFSCRTRQLWNMRILRVRLTASYFSLLLDTIERKLPSAICYKLYRPPVAGAQWDSLQSYIIACSPVCCLQGHKVPNFNLSVRRANTFSDTRSGEVEALSVRPFFVVMVAVMIVVVICLAL
jgi:hypothetical protein